MLTTIKKLRTNLTPRFGSGETEAIIRLIFHYLKGWSPVDMIINENKELSDYMKERIDAIQTRLLNDEPIQYIVGQAYFYGMEFNVNRDVLIPRPETEELIDIIVKENKKPDLRVLDIGTGSGCIAVTLARNLVFPKITALDISDKAIAVARHNDAKFKTHISFINADIFTWQPEENSFDIIVSNPPYIDESEKKDMEKIVLDHEPHSALFVPDNNPLLFYNRIADIAKTALSPTGAIYFEINPRHADELVESLTSKGFVDITITVDIHGKNRFISCRKPSE